FVIIGGAVADNVRDLTTAVQKWADTGPPAPPRWLGNIPFIGDHAVDYWQGLVTDTGKLLRAARKLIEPASALLLVVGKLLISGLLELGLSILIAFFLFRDG